MSELTERARRLLVAGLAGGHVAFVLCVIGFWLGGGQGAAGTAGVVAVIVIAFFTIGHAVQLWVADAAPKVVLFAALASYTIRVTLLGFILWLVVAERVEFPWIDDPAAVITTVVVAHGWLLAEFWAYRQLRIPAFDAGYTPPVSDPDKVT